MQVPHGPIRNLCAVWCSSHRLGVWGSTKLSAGGLPQGTHHCMFLYLTGKLAKLILWCLKLLPCMSVGISLLYFENWNFVEFSPTIWCQSPKLNSSIFFLSLPEKVNDVKGRHQIISHHSEAGDGGEAQRHQYWGLFLISDLFSEYSLLSI